MNENREALKAELVADIQLGRDAKKLLEAQMKILGKMKDAIVAELAMAFSKKTVTTRKFLWFTIKEESRGDLEIIEALQADLRVILSYEEMLNNAQNGADVAKMNLEVLNTRP